MVFIADINGTTKCVESTPIYQNSANVNKVVLLCPQPGNMMATVSFILPNGMATTPELMTNEGNDLIVDSNDNHLNAWSVTLKAPVTEYAGTCFVQFFFYPGFTDGQASAIYPTYRTSFTISPGVPTELPNPPTKDIYHQILNAMSSYNGSRTNQLELFGVNAYHLETWCDMLDADSTDNFISNRMNATESFEISEGANDGQLFTTESITIPLSSQEWTVTLDASTGTRTLVEIVGDNNFIKITGRGNGEYIVSSSFSNNTADIQYVADDDNILSIAYSNNKLTVYHNANAVLSEDITFIPFTTVYIGGQSTSNVSYTISTVKIHNVCLTDNEVTPLLSEATYRREKIESGEKYKLDVEMTFAQAIARTTKNLIARGEFDENTRSLNLYDSEDQVISVPLPELALEDDSAASISWSWVDEDANILEVSLRNASDEVISSVEIDLPIEQVVESGRYDSETRSIILVLSSGDEIEIPIEDFATDLATKSEFNTLKDYVETEIENISNTVDSIGDNVVKPSTKVEEETVEYIKSIPSDSASYVSIKKIGGMSKKSKNLLDFDLWSRSIGVEGGTKVVNGNRITLTATNGDAYTGFNNWSDDLKIPVSKGERIIFSWKTDRTDATGNVFIFGNGSTSSMVSVNSNNTVLAYDVPDGITFITYRIGVGGVGVPLTYYDMQIEKSSVKTAYEPFFEGIRDAKVTAVKSVGANLFDKDNLINRTYIDLTSGNLVTESTDGWYTSQPIYVSGAITYSGNNITSSGALRYRTLDAYGNIINVVSKGQITSETISISSNEKFIQFCLRQENIFTFCVNNGTEALPYSPYTEHTFAIPESVQSLEGYGLGVDNTYYNYIDFENKKFNRIVKNIVFTGNENITYETTLDGGIARLSTVINDKKFGGLLCSHYDNEPGVAKLDNIIESPNYPQVLYFFVSSQYSSAQLFKQYLAEQYANGTPVTVIYTLATPTTEDINITSDNLISVEGGGTLTFENEYAIAVPNLVTEYTGNNSAISSDIFVGNLLGNVNGNSDTASALKDASGNKTYNDIVALIHNYVEAQLITIPNRLIEGENSFTNAPAVAAYVSSGYWKMVLQFTIDALSIKMNTFSVTLDGNPSHQYTINDIEYTFNNNTLSVTISTRFQSDAFLNEADAKNTIGAGNYSYTAFR